MKKRIHCLIPMSILILSALAGCATIGAVQSNSGSSPSSFGSTSPFGAMDSPSPLPDSSPRLILPAGGGSPVMAIPLGAGVYLPLNADPVTVGIPLTP